MPTSHRLDSLSGPDRPRRGGPRLNRYRLYLEDGNEAGEAQYAVLIQPVETIWTGDGRKLRVVDVVPVEEDSAEFARLLTVEAV